MQHIRTNKTIERIMDASELQHHYRDSIIAGAVVTVAGHTYNADERSQERMHRHLAYLEATKQKTVEWITADGKEAPRITVEQLREIFNAAMALNYQTFLDAQGGRLTATKMTEARRGNKKREQKPKRTEL